MLDDANVMVVEDEAMIALDLATLLQEAGASVAGPYAEVRRARAAVTPDLHAAILDVDLADGPVIPLADELRARRIPFLFHTGTPDADALRSRYADVPVLRKGPSTDEVIARLGDVIRSAEARGGGSHRA
jgi:DNA-binding response OmpR family regulator